MSLMEYMALSQYELWYKQEVAPNLSREGKLALAKKISELSLEEPIHLPNMHYPHERFPELKQFSHTEQFSGMQLYAVFTEIMKELGMIDAPSASDVALLDKK